MKQLTHIVCILLLILMACSTDTELMKSTFRPDKESPELPEYSEWGYNTFGAFFDRQAFISNNREVPVKVVSTAGETTLTFKGQLGQYEPIKQMSLVVKVAGLNVATFSEMVALNATTLDLKSPNCQVQIVINGVTSNAQVLNGNIEFKRVQNLFIDKKLVEVILSGVFDFQAIINNEPVTMSQGRFDLGIAKDNFFSF